MTFLWFHLPVCYPLFKALFRNLHSETETHHVWNSKAVAPIILFGCGSGRGLS
jgi:hypothetical protein